MNDLIGQNPENNRNKKKKTKKLTFIIEKSNIFYHSWKIGSTILAFTSSFTYAYFAAFIHMMNDDEIEAAYLEDTVYNVLFIIDLIL